MNIFENIKNIFSPQKDERIEKIEAMLLAFKKDNGLPIYLNADLKEALNTLSNAKKWVKLVDKVTIIELLNVYEKWQNRINVNSQPKKQITKLGESHGFKKNRVWEGTIEEYEEAIKNGELSPEDEYQIIEYLPGYIVMDQNGNVTNQMN